MAEKSLQLSEQRWEVQCVEMKVVVIIVGLGRWE